MPKELIKEQEKTLTLDTILEDHSIVLFNDDVNTFNHVINSLVKYCKHSAVQAEQCAHIVHYNGKCQVKKGNIFKLKPICSALLDKGLSAEIIKY
jgi:ATP-dependent Clp protease adaptor protein ClpS